MKNELCRDIMKNMEQLKKNEIFEAEITAYNSEGSGVARILGRAVFVPRTIVGERWRIVIVKVTASAVYGRALEPVKLSPERREPECENYLRCGGCGLRHMSYAEELRFKKQRVDDALRHIAHQSVQVERITGSDETAHYRNKGIYAVREVEGRARKGFFAPRSHELVPVGRCLIQSDSADKAAEAVVRFMNDNGLRAYDEKTRKKRWKENSPEVMSELAGVLEGIDDFSVEGQEPVVLKWVEDKGYKLGDVMNAFRLTLVGEGKGPGMFDISAFLGKEETLNRLRKAIEVLS